MINKDLIKTWYSNAKELVKRDNPKAARKYVLLILNAALASYHKEKVILKKAKTYAFMLKWVDVSKDLYQYGVTDYVRECFGLPLASYKSVSPLRNTDIPIDYDSGGSAEIDIDFPVEKPHKPVEPDIELPVEKPHKPVEPDIELPVEKPVEPDSDGDDIAGLIDEASRSQGWCADVFEKNKRSVVKICIDEGFSNYFGTGFIISRKGFLITNHHVVFDQDSDEIHSDIMITTFDGEYSSRLEVLCWDEENDIALCRFDPAEMGDFSVVKPIDGYSVLLQGADCLIIGNAFGLGLGPITGIVRQTKNDEGDLVYTAPTNHGDSGSPVFNRKGECIGIHKSSTNTLDGYSVKNFANATPMDIIVEFVSEWQKKSYITL